MLSVVVPAFDEEACLADVVASTVGVLGGIGLPWEIVIVDDASTDGTPEIARRLSEEDERIRVVRHPRNMGSGQAITTGIGEATGSHVIYIPADGQFHLREIADFLAAAEAADIVIGARIERSDYSRFRLLSSSVFIWLLDRLFDQSYRDVNWVHLWRRSIFEDFEVRSRGVFFLEETLVRARRAGYSVAEIDCQYHPRAGGEAKGARLSTILVTIRDMLQLWWELRAAGRVSPGPAVPR